MTNLTTQHPTEQVNALINRLQENRDNLAEIAPKALAAGFPDISKIIANDDGLIADMRLMVERDIDNVPIGSYRMLVQQLELYIKSQTERIMWLELAIFTKDILDGKAVSE